MSQMKIVYLQNVTVTIWKLKRQKKITWEKHNECEKHDDFR